MRWTEGPSNVDMSEVSWDLVAPPVSAPLRSANLDVIFSRYVHIFICNDMYDKCTLVTREV